jgi:hypothetical protein
MMQQQELMDRIRRMQQLQGAGLLGVGGMGAADLYQDRNQSGR